MARSAFSRLQLHLAFMLGRSYIFQTFVKSGAGGSTASHPRCSEASCRISTIRPIWPISDRVRFLTYVTAATRAPDVRKPNSTVIVGRRDITSATAQVPSRYISSRLIPNSFIFRSSTCDAPEARDVIDKQHNHKQLKPHTRHNGR